MKTIIEDILSHNLDSRASVVKLVRLHGDASYRTYSRALLSDGTSLIVMQMPAGKASASEEITNFKGAHNELPFINICNYLSDKGLLVPQVYWYSSDHHIMLLQDLGDDLLAHKVTNTDESSRLEWYAQAIDLLVSLQNRTFSSSTDECVALKRSFDTTLLNWEFDHFLEYGIKARLGLSMPDDDLLIFNNETRSISHTIGQLPYGFTHRDFQSRNIIIHEGQLFLIDFQDALLGPAVYDLVALLRDSYVKLANGTVDALIQRYSSKIGHPEAAVRAEFNLITVQRKLKDAGRFVYIDKVKGNSNFLQYIPTSLEYARAALERLPERHHLLEMLKKYVPEWR